LTVDEAIVGNLAY